MVVQSNFDFGDRLRRERERLGLSQSRFAQLGRVGRHSQIRYETSDRVPDALYLSALAGVGVDVHYLVTGERRGGGMPQAQPDQVKRVVGATPRFRLGPRPLEDGMMGYGFFDVDAARAQAEARRKASGLTGSRPKPSWRDCSRICLPGSFLSRVIRAIEAPLVLAGPEAAKRLEPYVERLCDMPSPSRRQRIVRAALRWLLEAPNDALAAKEESPRPAPSWLIDALGRSAPLPGTQTPPSADRGDGEGCCPRSEEHGPEGPCVRPAHKARGVR